jgi:PAS domain S-box-containing protein
MGAKQVAADTGEKVGPAGPELLKELRALRSLGRKMEGESRLLAANFASLRQRREALRGLCVDADARVPPLWLLLDNMRGLVLRRIYRPEACAAPLVLFYGADAGALAGAGYRLPRDVAQTWYARIHPADQAAYQAKEARRERRHEGYTVEYRFLHEQSGAYHWARETAATPYQASSGIWILDSCILDITEQKEAEQALRSSEERYRAVVEDQSEYIRRFDADYRLTFVNQALCRLLQRPREALLGADLAELLGAVDARRMRRRLRLLTPAVPSIGYELAVARADGARGWQEWTDRALFDEAGGIREYQSVGRDITERKLAARRAHHLAQHDPLTDLANRGRLERQLRHTL